MDQAIRVGLGRWSAGPTEWRLQWILRVAVALEFIGHGMFGVIGKDAWLAYYELFGISADHGRILMPITGAVDITLGVLVLIRPTRVLLAYMAAWGLFTASLRPLADQGVWELVERSYNYGVPLALLLLLGLGRNVGEWVEHVRAMPRLTRERARGLFRLFQWIIALFLIGHGGLGLVTDKPSLIEHYDSIGLTSLVDDPASLNAYVGGFEIALGVAVLIFPATSLLLFVLAWKLGTELLHVTANVYGSPLEVIERAGCYAAPVAAIICRRIAQGQEPAGQDPRELLCRSSSLKSAALRRAWSRALLLKARILDAMRVLRLVYPRFLPARCHGAGEEVCARPRPDRSGPAARMAAVRLPVDR